MSENFLKKNSYLGEFSVLGIGVAILILVILFGHDIKGLIIKSENLECVNCRNEMDPEDEKHCILFSEYWGYKICEANE